MESLFLSFYYFSADVNSQKKKNIMASNDVKTNVSITLTGKEAENQIEVLKKKAEELRKKLQEAKQALYSTLSKIQNLKRFTITFFFKSHFSLPKLNLSL